VWDAFPDVRLERSGERLASPTFAVAPVRVRATHDAALDSLPATHKTVDFQVVFVCELEDGLLRRVRAFFDVYDVGVQLGILPVRGSLSAKALLALRGYGIGRSS
jgi:predicted ester cyclase